MPNDILMKYKVLGGWTLASVQFDGYQNDGRVSLDISCKEL
jgi:hypothetical protein